MYSTGASLGMVNIPVASYGQYYTTAATSAFGEDYRNVMVLYDAKGGWRRHQWRNG